MSGAEERFNPWPACGLQEPKATCRLRAVRERKRSDVILKNQPVFIRQTRPCLTLAAEYSTLGLIHMSLIKIVAAVSALTSLVCCAFAGAVASNECLVYFGTYTGPKSKGIYAARMDLSTGRLTPIGLVGETPNPTFLDLDLQNHRLYSANEISHFEGKSAGAVTAFSINPETGMLTQLNQRSSGGDGPCHLVLDKEARNILVANYGGGSVAVLPVQPDGTLNDASAFIQHTGKSINAARQEKPHAHCVTLDAANHFAFVCDLGIDKVMIYRFDPVNGKLTPNDPACFTTKPGAGPRHLAFHPNGKFAYLVNELDSTMTALAYDAKRGELRELQTEPMLPSDFKAHNLGAEVVVDASGKFVYGSNRGHNSIAVFMINRKNGTLKLVDRQPTLGKTPRHFAIDPTGKFMLVANQDSNNVVVFAVDRKTGRLNPTGEQLEIAAPVCVKFFPVK